MVEETVAHLRSGRNVVLPSATWAGKTRVSPALLPVTQREIWVLEPRRLAAAWRPAA